MWIPYTLTLFIATFEICYAGRLRSVQGSTGTVNASSDVQCQDPGVDPNSCVEYKFKKNKFEVDAEWVFNIWIWRESTQRMTCQSNGEWSSSISSYVAGRTTEKSCDHPLGRHLYWYGVGFSWSIGGRNVTCGKDGKWHGHVSKCKSHGYRLASGNDTSCPGILGEGECHEPGETVSVGSCGEADSQFTCGKYGRWIGKIPTCEGKHFEKAKWQFPYKESCVFHTDTEIECFLPAFSGSSPVGTFPWQAALAVKIDDKRTGSYNGWFIYCSGALVSDKWVLTAAHCLTEPSSRVPLSLANVSVFLGKHFRNDQLDDEHVKRLSSKKITCHPGFDPASFNNDIGLLELDVEVQFTERIRPICLPQLGTPSPMTDLQAEKMAVVAGWGKNHLNEPNEDLGHVLVKYANMSDCKKSENTNQDSFFCGQPYNDDDGWACPGDSGGPLIFEEVYDGHRRFVVEGLVSFGDSYCVDARTSFIKVRPYLCWIKDVIKNGKIMGDSRVPNVKSTCPEYVS